MSLKDHPTIIVGTLLILVAGLFWNIGLATRSDRIAELETKLSTYTLSNDIEAKELLSALREASVELKTNLQIINEVAGLRQENTNLTKRIKDISQDLQSVRNESRLQIAALTEETQRRVTKLETEKKLIEAQLKAKTAALEEMFLHDESFTLKPGEARTFGKYAITVGYIDYDYVHKTISVNFNNEKTTMEPGKVLTTKVENETCQIVLNRIDWNSNERRASFSLVVRNDLVQQGY